MPAVRSKRICSGRGCRRRLPVPRTSSTPRTGTPKHRALPPTMSRIWLPPSPLSRLGSMPVSSGAVQRPRLTTGQRGWRGRRGRPPAPLVASWGTLSPICLVEVDRLRASPNCAPAAAPTHPTLRRRSPPQHGRGRNLALVPPAAARDRHPPAAAPTERFRNTEPDPRAAGRAAGDCARYPGTTDVAELGGGSVRPAAEAVRSDQRVAAVRIAPLIASQSHAPAVRAVPPARPGARAAPVMVDSAAAGAPAAARIRRRLLWGFRAPADEDPARRVRTADRLVQRRPRPAGPSPAAAAPGNPPAGRTGRPGSAVPERADRPRGDRRAVRRHPRRGAGRLPAVAAVAAVPGAPARTVPRYTRADLLQVRGRVAGRVPQAEHCGAAGVLQRAGGRAAAHHRDRRGAVGQRSGVRRGALRAALRGVDGAGVVRPKAVPSLDDAGVWRDGARQPVEGDQLRTGDPRREPGLARQPRHRDQRGGGAGGRRPAHPVLPG